MINLFTERTKKLKWVWESCSERIQRYRVFQDETEKRLLNQIWRNLTLSFQNSKNIKGFLYQKWKNPLAWDGLLNGASYQPQILFLILRTIFLHLFSVYPETYEESLRLLNEKRVISDDLYKQMKELGSFRNILVHEYIKVNIDTLCKNFVECLRYFQEFSKDILKWLNRVWPQHPLCNSRCHCHDC